MTCLFVVQPTLAIPVIKEINQASLPKSEVEFAVQYYNCLNPVVFKGVAKSWGAIKWDFRFFKSKYGDVPVSVQLSEVLTGELQGPVKTVYINSTLKDYIDDVEKNGLKAGYLSQFDILNIHPELNDSLELPKFFKSKFLSITNLWIGPKGTNSKLHYDSDHNLFMQIHGKKLVTLISPNQSKKCYPINRTWYDGYSPIDPLNPNLEKYPLFNDVVMLQTVLEPGDILYIPQGWWHDIRSLDPSISVSFWWIDWKDFMGNWLQNVSLSTLKKDNSIIKIAIGRYLNKDCLVKDNRLLLSIHFD